MAGSIPHTTKSWTILWLKCKKHGDRWVAYSVKRSCYHVQRTFKYPGLNPCISHVGGILHRWWSSSAGVSDFLLLSLPLTFSLFCSTKREKRKIKGHSSGRFIVLTLGHSNTLGGRGKKATQQLLRVLFSSGQPDLNAWRLRLCHCCPWYDSFFPNRALLDWPWDSRASDMKVILQNHYTIHPMLFLPRYIHKYYFRGLYYFLNMKGRFSRDSERGRQRT